MKSKLNIASQYTSAGLVVGLAFAGAVAAAPLPKEGRYDTTNCSTVVVSNRIDFSKTHWVQTVELLGTTVSNPPGGLGDGNSYRCVGMTSSFDGKISGNTVCESMDQDGDKRLSSFSQEDTKTVRAQVAGTGKYEGMVQAGDYVRAPTFPTIKPGTIQQCNRQTGTYKLK
jgi:hypothetical protein